MVIRNNVLFVRINYFILIVSYLSCSYQESIYGYKLNLILSEF